MGSTFVDSDYGDTVESQLTLGTASLLGIFFGLVMVCGIFFGFGYSLGRRNVSPTRASIAPPTPVVPAPVMAQPPAASIAALTSATNTATGSETSATPKSAAPELTIVPKMQTAAASPAVQPLAVAETKPVVTAPVTASIAPAKLLRHPSTGVSLPAIAMTSATTQPATTADHAYVEPKPRIAKPSAIQPTVDQPNTRIPLQHVVPGPQFTAQNLPSPYFVWTPPFDVHYKKGFRRNLTQTAASRVPQGQMTGVSHPSGAYANVVHASLPRLSVAGPAMTVQVAALSRQDDAEVLVSALRERGFAPSIQSGSEDALYHVQVGPFSRDVAFATRQRLIAKGYNATLK
jgi:DedD protein